MRRSLVLASALALFAGTALAGDAAYRSQNHFSMRLPEGWKRIDAAAVRRAAKVTASTVGMQVPTYEAAFEREEAETPFEFPYILVQFMPGNTSGAYRDLEEKLMEGVEEVDAKHGAKLTELLGEHSFAKPVVDRKKNRIWMTMRADTPDVGPMHVIMALHLGSEGVAQVNLYTREQDAGEGRREIEAISDSLKFDDGYAFGDGGIFSGWMGKALIGGLIGLVFGLVHAIVKKRRKSAERVQAALTYEAVVPSPFGRPVPRKRVPAGPIRLDPEIDG